MVHRTTFLQIVRAAVEKAAIPGAPCQFHLRLFRRLEYFQLLDSRGEGKCDVDWELNVVFTP